MAVYGNVFGNTQTTVSDNAVSAVLAQQFFFYLSQNALSVRNADSVEKGLWSLIALSAFKEIFDTPPAEYRNDRR